MSDLLHNHYVAIRKEERDVKSASSSMSSGIIDLLNCSDLLSEAEEDHYEMAGLVKVVSPMQSGKLLSKSGADQSFTHDSD